MITNKIIFISALDWGLGHATRCVPLIKKLKINNKLIIGVTPLTKTIFNKEFADLQKIELLAYDINYSRVLPLWLKLLVSWPRINRVISQEKKLLEKIISENNVDVVISDSRFGLYSKTVYSIFITHQLFLKAPFATKFVQRINQNYILKFKEVWIPDFEDEITNLSGSLSHGSQFHNNVRYIGTLSRLKKTNPLEKKYNYLFLISGPEPQQTIFVNTLVSIAKKYLQLKFALVKPNNFISQHKNIETFFSPNAELLSNVIQQSKKIICRSGYSTIMDLHHLEVEFKNVVLVPTPGQTEQEYLASHIHQYYGAKVVTQSKLRYYTFID